MQHIDDQIWQLVRSGDPVAYEQLFRSWYQLLCRYSFTLVKDRDEAEEVVQTVFVNIWEKKERLQIEISARSYLYRAVHNESLNRIKHEKVKRVYADHTKSTAAMMSGPAPALETKELRREIDEAIESLPEQCGNVFRLSRFEQLKYSEIAELLNISVKTVENHMGKALRLMREKLKDYLPALITFFIYICTRS